MLKKLLRPLIQPLIYFFCQPRTYTEPKTSIFLRTSDGMVHHAIGTEIKIDTDLKVYTKIKNKWVLAPAIEAIVFQNVL